MKLTKLNAIKLKHGYLKEKNIRCLENNYGLLGEKDKGKVQKIATKAHRKFVRKYQDFIDRGDILAKKKDGDAISEIKISKRDITLLCAVGTGALCIASINYTHAIVPITLGCFTFWLAAKAAFWNQLFSNKGKDDYFRINVHTYPLEHRKKVKLENKVQKLKEVLNIIEKEKNKVLTKDSSSQNKSEQKEEIIEK